MTGSHFKRWKLEDPSTIAAIFDGCRRGIYVLHFADDQVYVGKTNDVVARYSSHRHGSKHHIPWPDVVAIDFMEVPTGDLDTPERETIRRYKVGHLLRNKTFNFDHTQPSVLDPVVPVEVQQHWATGQPEYERGPFTRAARRDPGPTPQLITRRRGQELLPDGRPVWDAVIDELAQVVLRVIPNAVACEGRFWSISDYPETAGGRFATLNVGWLELAAFPRARWEAEVGDLTRSNGLMWFINAELGTFVDETILQEEGWPPDTDAFVEEYDGLPVYSERRLSNYSIPVDSLSLPLGAIGVDALSPEHLTGIRRLAIHGMRAGTARVNARSYSSELTCLAYERITEFTF